MASLVRRLSLALLVALAGCANAPAKPEPSPLEPALAQYVIDEVPSDVKTRTFIDFEGKVAIIGYNLEPDGVVGPGQKFKLTLYWKSEAPLGPGWSLFTHLVVPGGARLPGNFDDTGPLRARSSQSTSQALPPSEWQPGKIYVDVQELEVPREIRAPEISVLGGVWRNNARLDPISGPSDNERRAIITQIKTGIVAPPPEQAAPAKKP